MRSATAKTKSTRTETVDLFPPQWLADYTEEELERLAIMTVDGGMTDEEAVELMIESERSEN